MLRKKEKLGKQFWHGEVKSDHVIKTLRYTSETFFAGVVADGILEDIVKREHFRYLDDALHCAHGLMNFRAGFHNDE